MKKFIYVFVFYIMMVTNMSAQVISDNLFAFGFENVFKWNVVFVEKEIEDSYIRMVMFDDISNIRDKIIICQLTPLNEKQVYDFVKSEYIVIDSLRNPYSKVNTLIAKERGDSSKLYAFIDHFGYLLNVTYIDKGGTDKDKFKKLIKTYINLKLDF